MEKSLFFSWKGESICHQPTAAAQSRPVNQLVKNNEGFKHTHTHKKTRQKKHTHGGLVRFVLQDCDSYLREEDNDGSVGLEAGAGCHYRPCFLCMGGEAARFWTMSDLPSQHHQNGSLLISGRGLGGPHTDPCTQA